MFFWDVVLLTAQHSWLHTDTAFVVSGLGLSVLEVTPADSVRRFCDFVTQLRTTELIKSTVNN